MQHLEASCCWPLVCGVEQTQAPVCPLEAGSALSFTFLIAWPSDLLSGKCLRARQIKFLFPDQ